MWFWKFEQVWTILIFAQARINHFFLEKPKKGLNGVMFEVGIFRRSSYLETAHGLLSTAPFRAASVRSPLLSSRNSNFSS